jgi:hypothetical protein
MTNSITPPPELVQQWWTEAINELSADAFFATRAAQWGADQELLACGNYLKQCAQWEEEDVTEFYNYRRPKPPSLKEQALAELAEWENVMDIASDSPIRRALEALPE